MNSLTMRSEAVMSKRELITRELDHMPEQDLDKLLAFLQALKESHVETAVRPWPLNQRCQGLARA
jgi:hypothetical protein